MSDIPSNQLEQAAALTSPPVDDGKGHDEMPHNTGDDAQGQPENGQNQPKLREKDIIERERAIRSGWKPKEEWDGDPEDFIRPSEWNRTVALLRRVDRERDNRERLQQEVDSFSDRIKNVMEVTKARILAELNEKKRIAIEEADPIAVQRADEEIRRTETDYAPPQKVDRAPEIRAEVEDWMESNPWFTEDHELQSFAISYQQSVLGRLNNPANPTSRELEDALKKTGEAVRRAFPNKFENTRRYQPPAVEGGGFKGEVRSSFGYNDLTSDEKKVLNEIERIGGMSRDDYIQAIKDMRGQK